MMRLPAEPHSDDSRPYLDACRLASDNAHVEVVFDEVRILTSPGVVMTPVPTTVALVDWAVEWIGSRPVRVADVGTGSGAVAVAVALRAPSARVWATDDSEAAVALARANVARHGLGERVKVLLGNLLEPVPGHLDLIVANLPYHAEALSRGLAESPLRDQPKHAIYAPGDGLNYYRDLLKVCRTRLDAGGALAIQLNGAVLAAGRGQLDQLGEEMETRGGEGRELRAAAPSGEKRRKWSAWQSLPSEGRHREVRDATATTPMPPHGNRTGHRVLRGL
jgi:methylase of polypeptide subunit release factors